MSKAISTIYLCSYVELRLSGCFYLVALVAGAKFVIAGIGTIGGQCLGNGLGDFFLGLTSEFIKVG